MKARRILDYRYISPFDDADKFRFLHCCGTIFEQSPVIFRVRRGAWGLPQKGPVVVKVELLDDSVP